MQIQELDWLLREGVIEPVMYPDWGTPIVPVFKPDGGIHLCGDYKSTLNKALRQDSYPVPSKSQILSELSGGKYFIKLDLSRAYLQLPVDEESAKAQTIVTHKGAFKVKRLQFGISSAPGIFQRFIETMLAGIPGVNPYYDDTLMKGEDFHSTATTFRAVLQRLSDAGIRGCKKKCIVGAPSLEFLGFRIDKEGMRPAVSKVAAIRLAPEPWNKEELQGFLGLLNFYHVFLKDKATVAEPSHRLLDKDARWQWTAAHSNAFEDVKRLLSAETLLTYYEPKRPLILTCDASSYGVGAVLGHLMEDGSEAPISFHSQTMSDTERRYSQIDKEALAIITGIKKFHDFLYGRPFEIRTDHKPLLGLFPPHNPTPLMLSPRMHRSSQMLSAYSYSLVYKPGTSIPLADALSRLPASGQVKSVPPPLEVLLLEAMDVSVLHAGEIARETCKDPIFSRVLNWVLKGWPVGKLDKEFEPYIRRQHELAVHKGCRVVVPPTFRRDVLRMLHDSHLGIVRTKALARSYVWWPSMDAEIERLVQTCKECQATRHAPPRAPVFPWKFELSSVVSSSY